MTSDVSSSICIIPLRDSSGNITYFIGQYKLQLYTPRCSPVETLGGQVNVTSELASGSKLDFLMNGSTVDPASATSFSKPEVLPSGAQIIYSPTLQANTKARSTMGAMGLGLGLGPPTPHFLAEQNELLQSQSHLPDGHGFQVDEGFHEDSFAKKLRRFGWGPKDKRAANVEQLIPGAEDMLSNKGFLPLQVCTPSFTTVCSSR